MYSGSRCPDNPIIALLTDFGSRSWYPAVMKGVILSICPSASVVDITHEAPSYNIMAASFILLQAVKYFPPNTIYVVVVDPGVGTKRRRIIIKTRRSFFVGPDNGVMMPAARMEGIEKIVEISNQKYMLPRISKTFEGRDVFAPAAAHIARGVPIEEFGDEVHDPVDLKIPEPRVKEGGVIEAVVIHVDKFGNVITNVPSELLQKLGVRFDSTFLVEIRGKAFRIPFKSTYGEVGRGEPLLLIDSSDYLELSVNMGSAAELFGLKEGDKITLAVSE